MVKVEIEPKQERAVVKLGGVVIAETETTVRLREQGLPERLYVPKSALTDSATLEAGRGATCPHKGDWHYYTLTFRGESVPNALWEYYAPIESCAAIAEHVAFDLGKVDVQVDGALYSPG